MEIIESIKKTGEAIEQALTPAKDGEMDILKKLHMEHEEVKGLLKKLAEEESAPVRRTTLQKLKAALMPHERAEEKVIYDRIIAQKEKKDKVDGEEGYVEHSLADKALETLSKIENVKSPEFTAAAKALRELLEHHISEEESDIWKDVKQHFDSEQRIKMNRDFEALKKKVHVA